MIMAKKWIDPAELAQLEARGLQRIGAPHELQVHAVVGARLQRGLERRAQESAAVMPNDCQRGYRRPLPYRQRLPARLHDSSAGRGEYTLPHSSKA